MKKHILIISLFAVCFFTACEKPKAPTTPTGNEPVPEDTNSLFYYLRGKWESIVPVGNSDFLDTVIITLTFYPSEYKFYQNVQIDSNVNPATRPYSDILFRGNFLRDYDLRGDSLYLRRSDGNFYYDENFYIIYQRSPDTMVMSYHGGLRAVTIRSYLFNRKK